MKRKIFLIILGVIVMVAAIIAVVFYATSGLTRAADDFFAAARKHDIGAVYALTSAELRNATTSQELGAYIDANRFDHVRDASWSSRSIENGLGTLKGKVTLDDGGVVPLELQLVKEGGGWKVSYIKLREAGVSGGAQTAQPSSGANQATVDLPPSNVIFNNARFATNILFDAARTGDVDYVLEFCQKGTTKPQIEKLVAKLADRRDAMDALKDVRPDISKVEPTGDDGAYAITGVMSGDGHAYEFTYDMIQEGNKFRLTGVKYTIR